MSLPAAWALQIGLRTHLAGQSALQAVIGDPARIYDEVPEESVFPLLTIGESRIREIDGIEGAAEHDVRINAWSRWGGRKEIKTLTDIVHDALHNTSFSVDGFTVVNCRFVFADLFRRPDADTYQGVMRYRVVTETPA